MNVEHLLVVRISKFFYSIFTYHSWVSYIIILMV